MSESLKDVLSTLFDNYPVCRKNEASLPIVDFDPLLQSKQMEVLAAGLSDVVEWQDVTAIVGLAERSSGPLVHLLAHRRRLPYSLVNWYPEGSLGDIKVGPALSFTGEKGNTYLNGLGKDDVVVFVDDCIRKGTNARKVISAAQAAGVKVKCAAFVANISGTSGIDVIVADLGVPTMCLCDVDAVEGHTKIEKLNFSTSAPSYEPPAMPTTADVKAMTDAQMRPKFQSVLKAFVDNPIYTAKGSDYPYCSFSLTDFTPMPHPDLIEDMAVCMVRLGDFSKADILVSEADRGGGPLVIAVARITGLPYTLANWEAPTNKSAGVRAGAQVGYSGTGSLYVNGIPRGAKCIVVDDMLSSGGTAEGLFKAIEAAGGVVIEGHYASEKVNTGGRIRLAKTWPTVPQFSMCYFLARGDKTVPYPPGPMANATPVQHHDNIATAELDAWMAKEQEAKGAAKGPDSFGMVVAKNIDKIAVAFLVLAYTLGG